MNTFTLGACFQHELHTGPYFMTFAPRRRRLENIIAILNLFFFRPKDLRLQTLDAKFSIEVTVNLVQLTTRCLPFNKSC